MTFLSTRPARPTQIAIRFFSCIVLACVLAPVLGAAPQPVRDPVPVRFDSPMTVIHFNQLAINSPDAVITLERAPIHGQLRVESDRFVYEPDDEFWSLELDSFVYRITDRSGSNVGLVPLYQAHLVRSVEGQMDFENEAAYLALERSESGVGNTLTRHQDASLGGDYGVIVAVDDGHAYFTVDRAAGLVGGGGGGGNTGGGGGGTTGWTGCLPSQGPPSGLTVVAVGGDPTLDGPGGPSLRMITDPAGLVLQGRTATGWASSQPVPLGGDSALFTIEWWTSGGTYDAILRVDGRATTLLGLPLSELTTNKVHYGLVPATAGTGPSSALTFDDISIYTFGIHHRPVPVQTADDFESGTINAWESSYGVGLKLDGPSADTGYFGLETDVSYDSYLVDAVASKPTYFVSQFRVDFTDYQTSDGDTTTLFAFGTTSPGGTPQVRMRFHLFGDSANDARLYATFVNAIASGTAWSYKTVLPKGPAVVTVQFLSATNPNTPNGHLRLWLDDQPFAEIHDLDSFGEEPEWQRLGLYSADPGTTGTLDFDDVLSSGY